MSDGDQDSWCTQGTQDSGDRMRGNSMGRQMGKATALVDG